MMYKQDEISATITEIVNKAKSMTLTKAQTRNMVLAEVGALLVAGIVVPKPLLVIGLLLIVGGSAFDAIYDGFITNKEEAVRKEFMVDRIVNTMLKILNTMSNIILYPAVLAYTLTK